MNKEYWQQKWQAKDIGFNQLQPHKLMQHYFPSLKLTPGCRVFVPLCGQSIDMLWLAGQGYQVIGVEFSQIACDSFFTDNKIAAKITKLDDFIVYKSREITLFCGDFFKLNCAMLEEIDAVYDRAALIALPVETRKLYSKGLIELMTPSTKMFLITMAYDEKQMQGPPFSVDEKEVIALYSDNFEVKQLANKPFEVPDHLKNKGLSQANEQVYLLTRK
jgi:thiopurine S-methyltransferase